jgi:ABC-type transporter Mla MlaB component
MAKQTKEEKRIDKVVEAAFNKFGQGIQFNIMDLGKIHSAGVAAANACVSPGVTFGSVLELHAIVEAVKHAIEQYRLPR